jgi:CheY-like chemotaxis protein
VILLDLMMPEMDGLEIVAALQEEPLWRDVPVIVITARDLNAKDRRDVPVGPRGQPGNEVGRAYPAPRG